MDEIGVYIVQFSNHWEPNVFYATGLLVDEPKQTNIKLRDTYNMCNDYIYTHARTYVCMYQWFSNSINWINMLYKRNH